ncbi:MAG: carboxypeptidase regulatory-like domain-containing protein, partial [Bacteroidales bacterium]
PDGEFLAVAYDSVVQVYSSSTHQMLWEKITDATIMGALINEAGTMVYVVENMPGGQNKANVSAYEVGEVDPVWQTGFSGTGTAFAGSGDRSVLAFCQYSGINTMHVIDAETGDVVFDTFYKNQNPPSLSYDGKVIVSGDYSGYVYLYKYNEELEKYEEKWNFKVGGGGTSAWVVGMGVSADGSTIAVGTLVFLSGGYDGEVYLFNSYSPEPLWVFEHAGDQVGSISLSDDGSIIAAAGYGPMDHSKPDFYLFRKQTSSPIFTLTTQGSFNKVDLSADGMLCSVTGKAVHARVMGSGGLLYNINANPGGGTITGVVQADNGDPVGQVKVTVEGVENYFAWTEDDGSYEIKYIPAGMYQVTAEKIGYYTEELNSIVVTEGGITNLDFFMEQTGNPPASLLATHGAGYEISLNWLPPDGITVEGYHVYRKTIPEAMFPEEPLASLGPDEIEYEDADVKPLNKYYYAVTAIIEDGVQSPYSNIAEGWMAQGFVIDEISVYYGSTPTIDGTMEPGEWDDAFMMDASDFLGIYDNMPNPVGSVTMYYKVNQEMTELYVACINENDTQLEDHDEVALYIDDNNDGSYPPNTDNSEGNYWAVYYAAGNELRYRPIYNTGGVGDIISLEDPQVEVSDALGYIVYEFMIPIGEDADWKINPNAENQSGMFTFTLDDPSNFDGYWPALNQQIFEPAGYGTMTFGAEDTTPVPPDDLYIEWNSDAPPVIVTLEWNQPPINDFDHFNVYYNDDGTFDLLTETVGTQVFYLTDVTDYTLFYITTVDKSGQESVPSEYLIFDVTIGIEENSPLQQPTVYPNPSSDAFNIAFDLTRPGNYMLDVLDMQGRLISRIYDGKLAQGQHVIRWEAGKRESGIYLLRISGENTIRFQKLILTE